MQVIGTDILDEEGRRPARRWNAIINAINSGIPAEDIFPPLGEKELADYNNMKEYYDKENDRIAKECEEKGIPVFRVGYDPVELD